MRILQLKTSATRGGAETMLLQLTRGLVRRDYEIMTILGEEGWLFDRMNEEGLSCRVMPLTSQMGLISVRGLSHIIREYRPDVILSHGSRVNFFGALAALGSGVPTISVEHNMDSWRKSSRIFRAIDRWTARRNVGRIAVSKAVGSMLVEMGLFDGDEIEVIPNGVEFPMMSTCIDESYIRRQHGVDVDDIVIVTVARLTQQKGHRYLIESLPEITQAFPRVKCLFLGDGDMAAELKAQVDNMGLGRFVVFAGSVDGVWVILQACDLFVLPSLWEGLPVSVIEAMGVGVPVIATDVAGTPEVVHHEKTGMLVPPQDSSALAMTVIDLLGDEDKCSKLAGAGIEFARESFSLDAVLDRYEVALNRWCRGR